MKRVNIELSDELHTGLKVLAVLKDVTMQSYIVEALGAAIEKDKKLLDGLKGLK